MSNYMKKKCLISSQNRRGKLLWGGRGPLRSLSEKKPLELREAEEG